MTAALPTTASPPVPPAVADTPRPRVLVVDDDLANRESLSRRLTRRGYDVQTAEDGFAALKAVEAGDFDVVVLDVMMPGISGLEVLTTLRKTHSPAELPVVMATANVGSENVVEALGLGANDYVTKPLDFAVVLARVQTQVALRQSVRKVLALEQRLTGRNAELEMANARLENANHELHLSAERVKNELSVASRVQASFLPKPWDDNSNLKTAWRYQPCLELAGDALNVYRLPDDFVGLYVLDVSGHGVASALTAITAARVMAAAHDPDSILVRVESDGVTRPTPPAAVVQELCKRFEWNPDVSQFITVFYALLHVPTRRLWYASAGHPPAVVTSPTSAPVILGATGLPVGVDADSLYDEHATTLAPGGRVYLYSDGVTEAMTPTGELFGVARLTETIATTTGLPLDASVDRIQEAVVAWRDGRPQGDDVSILALELP